MKMKAYYFWSQSQNKRSIQIRQEKPLPQGQNVQQDQDARIKSNFPGKTSENAQNYTQPIQHY